VLDFFDLLSSSAVQGESDGELFGVQNLFRFEPGSAPTAELLQREAANFRMQTHQNILTPVFL
jgi:hypothetical protein